MAWLEVCSVEVGTAGRGKRVAEDSQEWSLRSYLNVFCTALVVKLDLTVQRQAEKRHLFSGRPSVSSLFEVDEPAGEVVIYLTTKLVCGDVEVVATGSRCRGCRSCWGTVPFWVRDNTTSNTFSLPSMCVCVPMCVCAHVCVYVWFTDQPPHCQVSADRYPLSPHCPAASGWRTRRSSSTTLTTRTTVVRKTMATA